MGCTSVAGAGRDNKGANVCIGQYNLGCSFAHVQKRPSSFSVYQVKYGDSWHKMWNGHSMVKNVMEFWMYVDILSKSHMQGMRLLW